MKNVDYPQLLAFLLSLIACFFVIASPKIFNYIHRFRYPSNAQKLKEHNFYRFKKDFPPTEFKKGNIINERDLSSFSPYEATRNTAILLHLGIIEEFKSHPFQP